MILFVVYLLLILLWIRYTRLWGLLADDKISGTTLMLLFALKALAVPAFYFAYQKLYGGIREFDAGKFFQDALVIQHYAWKEPGRYLALLFGMQDDAPGSYDYVNCLVSTQNWDNGTIKDFLYNDNRIVIRVHSVLNFIAFDSYFVHALLNCLMSFIGIFFLYKSLRTYFSGKELPVLLVLCFFPSLWFYTGAVLKEGISVFLLGSSCYVLRKLVSNPSQWKPYVLLLVLLYLDLLLKPYVLFFGSVCFALLFTLDKKSSDLVKISIFAGTLLLFIVLLNTLSIQVKHRNLVEAALKHQRLFAGVAKGGLFLEQGNRYVRVDYDSSLVRKVEGWDSLYRLQPTTRYMYWVNRRNDDTLYGKVSDDSATVYKLVFKIPPSKSNLPSLDVRSGPVSAILHSWYFSMFYPLFVNAQGAMQFLGSFENTLLIIAWIILLIGMIRTKASRFMPLVLCVFCLSVCILISVTAPNSGALFRYRSPVVVFVFLSALYVLPLPRSKNEGK